MGTSHKINLSAMINKNDSADEKKETTNNNEDTSQVTNVQTKDAVIENTVIAEKQDLKKPQQETQKKKTRISLSTIKATSESNSSEKTT